MDHIIPAGSLRSYDDLVGFVSRLYPCEEGLRLVCRPCHAAITLAESRGISVDEAFIEKKVIEFKKLKSTLQNKLLESKGAKPGANPKEREKQFRTLLK